MRMALLAPDILREARELSPLVSGTGFALGLFLWLYGGRTHRFWLALVLTVAGGVAGLYYGPAYGVLPLVSGLLLAISAGALALSLARILLFAAAGLAGLAVAQFFRWDEPLVSFLLGGLTGLLFYRLWITLLASFAGTLLMAYSGICLLEKLGKVETLAWVEKNGPLLNWALAAGALLGIWAQRLLEGRADRKQKAKAKAKEDELAKKAADAKPKIKPLPPWWSWGPFRYLKKAS
jgi:hypothetical protein